MVTAAAGGGHSDVLFDRTSGALRSRGKTRRDHRFGSIGVDSQLAVSTNLIAVPSAALEFSSTNTDAYVDQAGRRIAKSDSDLSLGSLGGTFYYVAPGVLPFVQASLDHQFNGKAGVDPTSFTLGAGVVIPFGPAASLVAGVQTLLWKNHEQETRVNVAIRRNF